MLWGLSLWSPTERGEMEKFLASNAFLWLSALSWQGTGPFCDTRALRMMLAMTSGAIWAQWIFTPLAGAPSTAKSWYHHKVSVGREGSAHAWAWGSLGLYPAYWDRCSRCTWDHSSICALSYKEQLVLWEAGDCLDCSLCISLLLTLGVLDAELVSDLWTEANAGGCSSF